MWAWTFAKSQKVRNLERDPKATLQLEAGDQYQELRGVMIEAHTVIHRDTQLVLELGLELSARYAGGAPSREPRAPSPELRQALAAQATKRVALEFQSERIASFGHRKLAGVH